MEIYWTRKAKDDLERIYRFACQYNRHHADTILDRLIEGAGKLAIHPALGVLQVRYEPRELFDDYEVHYELRGSDIYIVDLWHTKEDR